MNRFNTINGDSNIAFFRGLGEKGLTAQMCPCMSFSVGEDGLRNLLPADMEGHYAAWPYFQTIRSPENDRFLERFLYEYPQYRVTDPMEAAYTGLRLWANAVRETKSTEPKKVRRAMLTERLEAPEGLTVTKLPPALAQSAQDRSGSMPEHHLRRVYQVVKEGNSELCDDSYH
jgi:urea transport system substrate-binding protein